MKKYLIVQLLLTLVWIVPASAQIITGFGSTQTNPLSTNDLQGAWVGTGSSSSTSFTITNAPNASNGGANGIFSTLSTPKSIVGNTSQLTLTGTLNSATPTTNSFVISLFDTGGTQELDYHFNWSSFAGGSPISITASAFAPNPLFNGTVGSFLFTPGGLIGDSSLVSFTFDQLQAGVVPEPATYVLLGLGVGLLGFCLSRRQKAVARI